MVYPLIFRNDEIIPIVGVDVVLRDAFVQAFGVFIKDLRVHS